MGAGVRRREAGARPFLRHRHGLPLRPKGPEVQGAVDIRWWSCPRRSLAARGCGLQQQPSGRGRHRVINIQVDPGDRKAGEPSLSPPTHSRIFAPSTDAPLAPRVHCRRRPLSEIREEGADSPGGYALVKVQKSGPSTYPRRSGFELTEERWAEGGPGVMMAFNDIRRNMESNQTAADFVRQKISEIVDDPEVARLFAPTDYPIGAKRICLDSDYYASFNRDDVTLMDVRSNPIRRIVESGIELESRARLRSTASSSRAVSMR